MEPGSPIVKKCSVCSKLILQPTIISGNTFGAIFWTDGKMEAPMLPDEPWLILCPFCHDPLWLDELKELGDKQYSHKPNGDIKDGLVYDMPSVDDYAALLEKGVSSQEKERYIRRRLWWANNDPRRTTSSEIPLSASEVLNMNALVELLGDTDANDLVMKIELLRELGRFDDTKDLLPKVVDRDYLPALEIIEDLIGKSDRKVREMHFA